MLDRMARLRRKRLVSLAQIVATQSDVASRREDQACRYTFAEQCLEGSHDVTIAAAHFAWRCRDGKKLSVQFYAQGDWDPTSDIDVIAFGGRR